MEKNFIDLLKAIDFIILFSIPWLIIFIYNSLLTFGCALGSTGVESMGCNAVYLILPIVFIFLSASVRLGWLRVMNMDAYTNAKRSYSRYSIVFISMILTVYVLTLG